MSEHLEFSVRKGIAKIVLNRPERMNAFTFEMIDAWNFALRRCQEDDEVKVVLVTGSGKSFCSGGDILEMTTRL